MENVEVGVRLECMSRTGHVVERDEVAARVDVAGRADVVGWVDGVGRVW